MRLDGAVSIPGRPGRAAASLVEAAASATQGFPVSPAALKVQLLALVSRASDQSSLHYGGLPAELPKPLCTRPAALPAARAPRRTLRLWGTAREDAAGPGEEPELSNLEMKRTSATGEGDVEVRHLVEVPSEWAKKVDPQSVQLISRQNFGEDGKVWSTSFYSATMAADPDTPLLFHVTQSDCPAAQRDVHIGKRLQMLGGTGLLKLRNIVPAVDTKVFDSSTFVLRPDIDSTLHELLMEKRKLSFPEQQGRALFSYGKSLRMIVDILRGLRTIEQAGVVAWDLSPKTIAIKDDRAYVDDFGKMCLEHSGDTGFGCACYADTDTHKIGSAVRHAPEMVGGRPTGASNHVWQAGLVLAEIVLGDMPVETLLMRDLLATPKLKGKFIDRRVLRGALMILDREVKSRAALRAFATQHFDIAKTKGFGELPLELQKMLLGMLAKDVDYRWSTEEALEKAEGFLAKAVSDAPALELPSEWYSEIDEEEEEDDEDEDGEEEHGEMMP